MARRSYDEREMLRAFQDAERDMLVTVMSLSAAARVAASKGDHEGSAELVRQTVELWQTVSGTMGVYNPSAGK